MSLQFASTRSAFVNTCAGIWKSWLAGAPMMRKAQREAQLGAAVRTMTTFMVTPTVQFANTSGWGAFNWTSWLLKVNGKYTGKDDIRYKDFVEVCCTIYHETRHGEQFYRIAQGLAAGALHFPDASVAQSVQAMGAGSSFRAKVAMFEAASRGQDPLQSDRGKRVQTIATRLSIPTNVASHADAHRDYFRNYLESSLPTWYKRPTALDEVNEWMRATYKKTFSEMDTWAQGSEGPYRIYRDLPEENDAHGIEEQVERALYQKIGFAGHKKRVRTDPVFGP